MIQFIKYTLLAVLILGNLNYLQAQEIVLSGKIIDQDSQEALSFVHISLCSQALGTTSNEQGDFRLILPSAKQEDSLCISYIGYKTQKIAINDFLQKNPRNIALQANIQELATIQVRSRKLPDAKGLVGKAIKRIVKNYPLSPYLMEGYYRDYLQDSTEQKFLRLLEAAVGIYDPGYEVPDESSRIKVYQSRHSNGYPLNYADYYENNLGGRSGNISIMGGNELSVLMYNNPVRNYARISDLKVGYELNAYFLDHHHFEIEDIGEEQGETVYGITITANDRNPYLRKFLTSCPPNESYHMKGKMYIRERDAAILKMDYAVIHQKAQQIEVFNELKLDFRLYQGNVYLHYISFSNFIIIQRDFTRERYRHFRELFIHQIRTENLPAPDTFYLFSNIGKLHDQSYLNEPRFWEKYNMVLKYLP